MTRDAYTGACVRAGTPQTAEREVRAFLYSGMSHPGSRQITDFLAANPGLLQRIQLMGPAADGVPVVRTRGGKTIRGAESVLQWLADEFRAAVATEFARPRSFAELPFAV